MCQGHQKLEIANTNNIPKYQFVEKLKVPKTKKNI